MKILLMVPLVPSPPPLPDIGLGYLAAALCKASHQVHVWDWNRPNTPRAFERFFRELRPQAVGIKVFTKDIKSAIFTNSMIKAMNPRTSVIIGGPHVNSSDPQDIMDDFQQADFALRGEADGSLPALLDIICSASWEGGGVPIERSVAERVAGLVWRKDDAVMSNPPASIVDLDNLGIPAWDLINPRYYPRANRITFRHGFELAAPIITGKGCIGHCSYCSVPSTEGRFERKRSLNLIKEEILLLHQRYGVSHFAVTDNVLTKHTDDLMEFAEMAGSLSSPITWGYNINTNLNIFTRENIKTLWNCGCRSIAHSIESGDDGVRARNGIFGTLAEALEQNKLLTATKMQLSASFMFGFPEETYTEMQKTLDVALSLRNTLINFEALVPYPGTRALEYVREKHGLKKWNWPAYALENSPFHVSKLPNSALYKILKRANLLAFFSSGNIQRMVVRAAYNKIGKL